MLKLYKNERGFTLIELLVVLAIIAILAAVAIPALMNYTQRARETRVLGELASFKTVVEAWAVDEGKGHYPDEDPATSGDPGEPGEGTISAVMEKAEIVWESTDDGEAVKNPWGGDYYYAPTKEEGEDAANRGFIIWTDCEPDDGYILYVTNTTDPVKAHGSVEDGELKITDPEDIE